MVGFGRIGREFAKLIRPFGVELLVSDPYADARSVNEQRRFAGGRRSIWFAPVP